jgi:hypothetical protein
VGSKSEAALPMNLVAVNLSGVEVRGGFAHEFSSGKFEWGRSQRRKIN